MRKILKLTDVNSEEVEKYGKIVRTSRMGKSLQEVMIDHVEDLKKLLGSDNYIFSIDSDGDVTSITTYIVKPE